MLGWRKWGYGLSGIVKHPTNIEVSIKSKSNHHETYLEACKAVLYLVAIRNATHFKI